MVKYLTQGHKCPDWDVNPHPADQKHLSLRLALFRPLCLKHANKKIKKCDLNNVLWKCLVMLVGKQCHAYLHALVNRV